MKRSPAPRPGPRLANILCAAAVPSVDVDGAVGGKSHITRASDIPFEGGRRASERQRS